MEFLAISKSEGTVPLDEVIALEEQLWGYHSSIVVITSSHRVEWVTALKELIRRRIKVLVVLLDGMSFGGIYDSTAVVPKLYEAGVSPYIVKQGDSIPVALSHTYTTSDFMKETVS